MFTEHLLSAGPHAVHWGYACVPSECLYASPPQHLSAQEYLSSPELTRHPTVSLLPQKVFLQNAVLSFLILSFPKCLLCAGHGACGGAVTVSKTGVVPALKEHTNWQSRRCRVNETLGALGHTHRRPSLACGLGKGFSMRKRCWIRDLKD